MPILEDLKEYAERATELRRPGRRKAPDLVQVRKPPAVRFKDDGLVPDSSTLATDHLSKRRRSR